MGRRLLWLLIPGVLGMFLSCNKPGGAANPGANAPNPEISESGEAPRGEVIPDPPAASHGYALRVNTGLYAIDNDTGSADDTAKWIDSIALGEKFSLLAPARKAVYQGAVYDFVKIRRFSEKEGYVILSNMASGGELGVVSDDTARIYRSPQNIDVSNTILSRKTVVIWYPETEQEDFVGFRAYDSELRQTFASYFIKKPSISVSDEDIQSSILLQTAQALNPTQDKVRIEALLEIAAAEYPGSIFAEEIQNLANPPVEAPPPEVRAIPQTVFTVNDSNVNIRDKPDAETGAAVGQLQIGDKVTSVEETAEVYTLDGSTNRWFRITSPMTGWVFGSYLEPNGE